MKKTGMLTALGALLIGQGLISGAMFSSWQKRYSSHNVGIAPGLSIDQLLASIAGLREMVAGILWVQSDEFFHTGQFDAILPVIRLVTWLNPKQLEVFSTGSWHIGYNFTDEQNRSDRRYIPLALRLLQEGIANNPDTYEMYHDMGWMYYNKIDDNYPEAVKYFEIANTKPDILPALRGILAGAYQRNGQPQKALDQFWKLQQMADERFKKSKDPQDFNMRETAEKNTDNTIVRMVARGVFARQEGVYDKYPYDTRNPIDLDFTVKVTVVEPKLLRVTGTWGIPTTGARIRMVLRDSDYNLLWEPAPSLDFDRDKGRTYMQDQLYTQNGRFDRKIDMSRNPTMYPFKSDKYYVEFYFNPRSAPPHIQDRIGWDGEGMTDKRYLNTTERPGARILFARFELTRDQLLRRGAGPFFFTSPGFKEIPTKLDEDVIIRRSLRAK